MKRLILISVLSLSLGSGCGRLTALVDNLKAAQEKKPTQNSQIQEQPSQNNSNNVTNNTNNNITNINNNTTNNYYYQPPQVIIIERPKTYQAPVVSIKIVQRNGYAAGSDGILSWTNVGARSYTVYRTWTSPTYREGWVEVATLAGFNMTFPEINQQGIHFYKVVANFDDGIQKESRYVQP